VRALKPAPPAELLEAAVAGNVQRQVGLLKTESAIPAEHFKAGKIDSVGTVHALATGKRTRQSAGRQLRAPERCRRPLPDARRSAADVRFQPVFRGFSRSVH